MDAQRPAPRVTVHDPSRAARPLDLLESGDADSPRPNPLTRRRIRLLAGVLLLVALGAAGLELRDRRAAAAEERRLAGIVDLSLEPRGASTGYDPVTGRATLELQVRLANDGPRDVTVERGGMGSYRLVQRAIRVRPGSFAALTLRKDLTCSPDVPPPAESLRALELALRTAAGPRQVSLPLTAYEDDAARACGFYEPAEAVQAFVSGIDGSDGRLVLALDLFSRSVRALALVGVQAGPGLAVRVSGRGDRDGTLPLTFPIGTPGGGVAVPLDAQLVVTDCAAARTAAAELTLWLRADDGRVGQALLSYEPGSLASLLTASCAG